MRPISIHTGAWRYPGAWPDANFNFGHIKRLIQKLDARTYRVAGKLPVDDLNAATGLTISNEAYDTVGGWVLDLFGRVPRRGERVETPELSVTVEKIERTRVVEVLLSLRTPQSTEKAA